MKEPYNLYNIKQLFSWNGGWIRETNLPARPERYYSWFNDFKLAWLVFTRKADAFIWDENDLKN